MKSKTLIFAMFSLLIFFSCSNSEKFSEDFIKDTTGSYFYSQDEAIEVFYENNKLFLNWKGGTLEPVVISKNEFFVADMYAKLHFVQHPKTNERYLSILSEEDKAKVTYDYLKMPKNYKPPSDHLKAGDFDKALAGYLKIKNQDSTSVFINERHFNGLGYKHIRNHDYEKAIGVLKLNAALHPNSANVYDSLAEAYLLNGDSLNAYVNYKKTLEIYSNNTRAQNYIDAYKSKEEM